MSSYPATTGMLHEVLGIKGADRDLPLQVIINLHRVQLQEPLLRLARSLNQTVEIGEAAWVAENSVASNWPALQMGHIFRNNEALDQLSNDAPNAIPDRLRRRGAEQYLRTLLENAMYSWVAYEPLAMLYQLAWPESPHDVLLQMLEIELGLDPAVQGLILDYAKEVFE